MAFNAYSAKNCKARFNGVTITVKGWNVRPEADALESTNAEGGGFYECIAGIRKCDVSIKLNDNGAANIFDAGLTAGAIVANVKLYLNDTTGPYWNFPSFFVKSPAMDADVKNAMEDTIEGNGTGTFSYPTGSAGTTT